MRPMQGRAVLISGAGSGLGRAIAIRIAAAGGHPVVGDINDAAARATVEMIENAGGSASPARLDVTDSVVVRQVVQATAEQFGPSFDGLVNNAGTDQGAGLLDISDEQWSAVLAVNQSGPLFLSREFLRTLDVSKPREFPADVVNVISISAITVGADAAAYNSSKAALAMLTKVMQREAYEHGWPVRIHGLMPSAMNTPMMEQWHLSNEVMMAPDTVAGAVEYMMTLPPDSFVQNLVINSRREPGWPR